MAVRISGVSMAPSTSIWIRGTVSLSCSPSPDFKAITYDYVSNIHRPYYLRLSWGSIKVTAVLKSYTLTYSLFKPDGTALRASIDAQFTESIDYSDKINMASPSSPDLTHFRTVRAGDTLPLMAYKIYGDSKYYLQLAQSTNNALNSIYGISPGDTITFDPLEKLPAWTRLLDNRTIP